MKNPMYLKTLGILLLATPGTVGASTTILVDYNDGIAGGGHDAEVRKGGFTGLVNNADTPADLWLNFNSVSGFGIGIGAPVGTTFSASTAENSIIGSNNQFTRPALDLGYVLSPSGGETFDLGFNWRDASAWDANDTVDMILYFTADNTIRGVATDLITLNSGVRTGVATWEPESASGLTYAIPGAAGKNLFLRFNTNSDTNHYARLDDIYVAVTPIPEPSAALLGALGAIALLRRRR